jgi:hypothetical protein
MADDTEQEIPLSWMAMPYRVPVLNRNGRRIGTAESLEGDVDKDIFHGIVVKLDASRELRELLADRVTSITNRAVSTDLAEGELESLPPYTEEHAYHLDWGGLFRKHPEWKEDSS